MEATRTSSGTVDAGAPAQVKGKSNRVYVIFGGVILVIASAVTIYAVLTMGHQNTDDAQIESDVVPLSVRTGGLILRVLVQDNQMVKAGEVIMELDPADQAARVAQSEAEFATAKAQAASAEAQVAVVEANVRGGLQSAKASLSGSSVAVFSAEAQVSAAKAGLDRSRAELRKADLDLDRTRSLRNANAVPQERLDNAQVAHDSAAAQLQQATANLAAAEQAKIQAESHVVEAQGRLGQSTPIEAQIAAAHAAVDLAHAAVQAAQARLDLAHLVFGYLRVTAPVDGMVSRLSAHEGQLLQTGQSVAELVPTQTYVVANFKETQIGKMRPGQPAEVEIDAFEGHTLHGRVESISGGTGARFSLLPPDNASGNYVKVVQRVPVRIALSDVPKDFVLRAGLSADVTVNVRE